MQLSPRCTDHPYCQGTIIHGCRVGHSGTPPWGPVCSEHPTHMYDTQLAQGGCGLLPRRHRGRPSVPTAATSCSLKEQGEVPQVESTEIYSQEEWALIHQKDPALMQVQRFLSRCSSLKYHKVSNTARAILRQLDRLGTPNNVLYHQSRIPTEQ